jgi:voltage-gated potassium channel
VLILLARLLRANHGRHIAILLAAAVACILGGGIAFAVTQHLPLTTGWYWALTTATTVGYGDVTPKNASGRLVASATMLTTIPLLGASFALFTSSAVSSRVRRLLEMTTRFPEGPYRLVVGLHPAVPAILEELQKADADVVLVADVDAPAVREGVHVVRGNPTAASVIRSARPAGAVHALVASTTDADTLVSTILLREEAPELPITAVVASAAVAGALRELGITNVLSESDLVAHTLAKSLEAPHAGELLLQLLSSEQHRLEELTVEPTAAARPLSAVRAERNELVLGVVHGDKVSLGVGEDPDVGPGDVLLVVKSLS